MHSNTKLAAIVMATAFAASPAFAEGDAKKGEKVFKKCKACHVVEGEPKKTGPTLENVFGRTAGTAEYKFSKAMKKAGEDGLVWNEETIAGFLAKPKKYLKGTRMSFSGLKKEADIENILAYLKQYSKEAASE